MDIRFVHIADLHLGARPVCPLSVKSREQELWDALAYVVSFCEKERIELLLISGDLFHEQPSFAQAQRLNEMLQRCAETQVVWIAGNHDHVHSDSAYYKVKWGENIHPLLSSQFGSIRLLNGRVTVYGRSFDRREIRESVYKNVDAAGESETEILLAHGGDSAHAPFTAEELRRKSFTYMALGHIHKPLTLIPHRAAYPGALSPIDRADVGAHGFILGNIENGACRIRRVRLPFREYRNLTIELSEMSDVDQIRRSVQKAIDEQGQEHMYNVHLRGSAPYDHDVSGELFLKLINVYNNIVCVCDRTKPKYDLAMLQREYPDSFLSVFIERMRRRQASEAALEVGVETILNRMLDWSEE